MHNVEVIYNGIFFFKYRLAGMIDCTSLLALWIKPYLRLYHI